MWWVVFFTKMVRRALRHRGTLIVMTVRIELLEKNKEVLWDEYVLNNPQGTPYHLSGWWRAVGRAYGHRSYCLIALRDSVDSSEEAHTEVAGVLPLIHLKHPLFGNSLISLPFCDIGGVIADDAVAETELLRRAVQLARELRSRVIELRHVSSHPCLSEEEGLSGDGQVRVMTRQHKVRMLRELMPSSEDLMRSFKAKLRSQIRRPVKDGLSAVVGEIDLLDDFYDVFARNMRDLGSPVHSKRFIEAVFDELSERSKFVIVYHQERPLACSMVIGCGDTLENPWASALHQYSRMSPNMLLYWTMLEYACNSGYRYFDFGRSSPGEGTYRFKEQWGAQPSSLHWNYVTTDGSFVPGGEEGSGRQIAVACWKRLPVPLTRFLGPPIRKHIGL